MKVNKLKLALIGGAAGLMGIGGVLAPVGASTLASSSAPAPIRAAAGAAADATLPSAEAGYITECKWTWGIQYTYTIFGKRYYKYNWIKHCYQRPN